MQEAQKSTIKKTIQLENGQKPETLHHKAYTDGNKHIKKCSTSLATRERQPKTTRHCCKVMRAVWVKASGNPHVARREDRVSCLLLGCKGTEFQEWKAMRIQSSLAASQKLNLQQPWTSRCAMGHLLEKWRLGSSQALFLMLQGSLHCLKIKFNLERGRRHAMRLILIYN